MQYISHYSSPLGKILLAADHSGLTGLWFEGQKYFALGLEEETKEQELPVFQAARRWLDQLRIAKGWSPKGGVTARYGVEEALNRLADHVRSRIDIERLYRKLGVR